MNKTFTKYLLLLLWLFSSPGSQVLSQPGTNVERLKGFDEFVEQKMKDWNVQGAAVSIIKNGEIILVKGYGYRDIDAKLPVTANTLFAIGSCTKAFTAASVCLLVEEGKVDLDKPVINYIPAFKMWDDYVTLNMTPRDLLTHRSGLPRHDLVWYGADLSKKDYFDRLRYLEPSKSFRTAWQYQNLMFMTAGYLVEQLTGETWEDFVKKKILEPLGMNSTNFSIYDIQKSPDYSRPYVEVKGVITEVPYRPVGGMGPAGSINSSVTDMANWVIINLNGGKFKDKQILSENSVKQMQTPYSVVPGQATEDIFYNTYGLGWFITSYRGHLRVEHGGNIDGFSASVGLLPLDTIGVVVLTNMNNTGLTSVIRNNVLDRMLDLNEIDWSGKLLEDRKKSLEAQQKSEETGDPNRVKDTEPSHPLESYTGEYQHPAYGTIEISLISSGLKGVIHGINFDIEHYHYDIFEGSNEIIGKVKFKFSTNMKGEIDELSVPLEDNVKHIVFNKVVEKKEIETSKLNKYIGEYDISGTIIKVTFRGSNTLIMTVPGQPDYELVTTKENEFDIKNLKDYSVRFNVNSSGDVTEILLIQPNGTFTAKKK